METYTLKTIARYRGELSGKFGLPRQAGIVEALEGRIVFEPEYRSADALRGIEGFSHLWLIWQFSEAVREGFSPTVRPPRLGGNARMGVFATRSPFRPNALGLSCVKLLAVETDPALGPVLRVSGADLMDGTPIYDIKPYLLTTDCHPEATKGFTQEHEDYQLEVEIPEAISRRLKPEKLEKLQEVLAQDPRPAYHHDEDRVYGFPFDGYEVRFSVMERKAIVQSIRKM